MFIRPQARKVIVLAISTIVALLSISATKNAGVRQEPMFWTASAMEAIELHQRPPLSIRNPKSSQIELIAAKGEYEAFQIVVRASAEDLNQVNLVVSDLKSADGATIDRHNITLYREHYIKLDRPSYSGWSANPTRGRGWYADGLIPFNHPDTGEDLQNAELDAVPFNLPSKTNQPIWVDIQIPRSAMPGKYQGKFTVESDRGISEGQIELTVWDFELPVEPSLDSFFDIWENRGLEAQTLLLEHRLMPSQRIEYPNQAEVFERLGVKSVRLPFWSGANYQTCKMDAAPSVARFKQAADRYPADLLRYVFSVDEIDRCKNLEQPLKQWAKNIHAAGLKHFAVMTPKPALYDDIDIWVVNPRMYAESQSEIRKAKQRGDEVWFYTGYTSDYSPLWHLDFAPINFRIAQGWIAQSLDLDGVMIARADEWTENPWEEVPVYVQQNIDYPGVEMFFYPGDKVGLDRVVPSIRLKRLREGMEDYEYVEILKNLGQGQWAMNIVRDVGKNWGHWTKNPDTLYRARYLLGEKIDRLAREHS